MSQKTPSAPFKIVPQSATHWMALSACEISSLTLPAAHGAYNAMLVAAPVVVLAAMNVKEVNRCIEVSRQRAQADTSISWAQHLVLVVQQAMACSMGAIASEPHANAPTRAVVL